MFDFVNSALHCWHFCKRLYIFSLLFFCAAFFPLCLSFLPPPLPPFCWKDGKAKRAQQTSRACFEERMKMMGCHACKLSQREIAQVGFNATCVAFNSLRRKFFEPTRRRKDVLGCHKQGRFSSWNGPCLFFSFLSFVPQCR